MSMMLYARTCAVPLCETKTSLMMLMMRGAADHRMRTKGNETEVEGGREEEQEQEQEQEEQQAHVATAAAAPFARLRWAAAQAATVEEPEYVKSSDEYCRRGCWRT
jgi:hypothetical protein